MEHLDDNAASEFVSGTLAASALGKVETHLAGCRDCRALVAALAQGSGDDSSAATFRYELLSASQVSDLPRRTLSVGDRVGRYLVLSSIGAGGMGVVFAAYDPQLDRKIALKLLRSGLAVSNKDARARLRREAQAIAQLSHPNVVSVYDVGTTDDGDLYIAMEFVEGDTLTTWLKKYPRTWREIIDVFLQAARGLVAAHGVGLLHRDFKPDNVLVGGDGRVRVTDFGLARSLLAPDELTQARPEMTALDVALTATGTVLGTPRYMPPEQMTGLDLDARSDQFSFCVALYEALYGKHPLEGSTSVSMLEHGKAALPPPEGTRVPSSVAKAVMRGLAKERTQRWPTMAALVSELTPPVQHARGRTAAVAMVGVIVLGVAAAAVMASHRPQMITADGPDSDTIRVLVDQINILETQVKQDRKKLLELDLLHGTDVKQIEHDKEELLAKETRIQALVEQVTKIRIEKVLPKSTTQGSKVIAAVPTAQHDLEGC
ncbi:MAG TPA: protein kinase, partial [Kofleriaceae bacterium]|nr:protein kinase [Kofleriaceae bacterium]